MKRFCAILCLTMLLFSLTACTGPAAGSPPPVETADPAPEATEPPVETETIAPETETPPAEVETPAPETPAPEDVTTQRDLFDAVTRQDVLAVVLYEPTDEELAALGREPQVLDDSNGEFYDTVLIVPRFGDCAIALDHVAWEEASGDYVVTGPMGKMEAGTSADDPVGGLLVRSELPEGDADLLVTVTRGDKFGRYLLTYDGRGGSSAYIIEERVD